MSGAGTRRTRGARAAAAGAAHGAAAPEAGGSARNRILDAAAELFYRHGIRAVGVDAVIAHSGVAKMSLYRCFAGKDDLAAAFLREYDARYWAWWDGVMARHPDDPRAQIRAVAAAIAKRVASPNFRGCPFLNAATEFPEPDHPVRAAALANKHELRRRLKALAGAAGARAPAVLADQLMVLIEGAYALGHTLGREGAAEGLAAAADTLMAAQLAEVPGPG